MKKRIAIITNALKDSGVGSRAYQIARHIGEQDDVSVVPVFLDGKNNTLEVAGKSVRRISSLPSVLGAKSVSWVRLGRHIPKFDMYDISNQTLSFIARNRHPSIVTVHDIIELTHPQDPQAVLLNKYLMSGITHADSIVAVSEYTKQSIHQYFNIPESEITVIPNGVDEAYGVIPNFTSSIAYQELIREMNVADRRPVILSVGSEHPRKNMETILHVVAKLKKQYPDVLLLKIGEPGLLAGRAKTLETIDALKLQKNVQLLGRVPTDRMNELYNLADVLLFPSRAEGFGMPPLEAMAAHCPVVCSNATSLPEVTGGAAIMHNPDDADAFTKSIVHIVNDSAFRNMIIEKGAQNVMRYSWKVAAEKMLELYRA